MQCECDVVGTSKMVADAEFVRMVRRRMAVFHKGEKRQSEEE
jgi:histidyl-tRNA synthetase